MPTTDNTKKNIARHLSISKVRFLDNIFLCANFSIASKFAKIKAFFLVSLNEKKYISIIKGIIKRAHKYSGL